MNYTAIPLRDLISEYGKEKMKKHLSGFCCEKDITVEDFIRKKAITFEEVGLARTILVYPDEYPAGVKERHPCACFSITAKEIEVHSSYQKDRTSRKKTFGTGYSLGDSVNAILLGQFAKNFACGMEKTITGDQLMDLMFERITKIDALVPSVVVWLECRDNPKITEFYERSGFEFYDKNERNGLLRYILSTRKIISEREDSA